MTPKPNSAKSYFAGSLGSKNLKISSSSETAFASFCFLFSNPSFLAVFPECTSKGQDSKDGFICFQIPKSTI